MLDINLTHGLAVALREIKTRLLEKTFKIQEEIEKKKELKKSKKQITQ